MTLPRHFEFRRERIRPAREHDEIAADRDKEITHVDATLAVGLADENPGRFAGLAYALARVFHHFPDFRMLPVAQIPHVGCEIVRAYENAVDAVGFRDR